VLVLSDMLGMDARFQPRFARRYAQGHAVVRDAVNQFVEDVRGAKFPAREEVLA
jgi:3-methyl-2-oxobutanoate hydroxymethyltransferase